MHLNALGRKKAKVKSKSLFSPPPLRPYWDGAPLLIFSWKGAAVLLGGTSAQCSNAPSSSWDVFVVSAKQSQRQAAAVQVWSYDCLDSASPNNEFVVLQSCNFTFLLFLFHSSLFLSFFRFKTCESGEL